MYVECIYLIAYVAMTYIALLFGRLVYLMLFCGNDSSTIFCKGGIFEVNLGIFILTGILGFIMMWIICFLGACCCGSMNSNSHHNNY